MDRRAVHHEFSPLRVASPVATDVHPSGMRHRVSIENSRGTTDAPGWGPMHPWLSYFSSERPLKLASITTSASTSAWPEWAASAAW